MHNFVTPHIRACLISLCLCMVANISFANDPADDVDTDDVFLSAVEQTIQSDNELRRHKLADEVISYANRYLGRPYRRGAKGPKAFDCSGFTSFVFRNFDTHLAASSREQYLQGVRIETADVEPGDLLFFSSRRSGKSVGHVGIAVEVSPDGKISFIHAAIKGGIRIDSYPDGGYYSNHYVGARRVL